MSEDILAQVREELQPKTMKEGLILLAAETREMKVHLEDMKRLQREQNGKVNKNCNRLTSLETIVKVGGAVIAAIAATAGAIIARCWPL